MKIEVKKIEKKPKKTQIELWREWYAEKGYYVRRYKGLKGIYWYFLSQQVRQEDFEKYNGECIDQCGGVAETWQQFDCGHGIPASRGGFGLLFRRENLAGQLKKCNNPKFSPHSPVGFMIGVDKRWGVGTTEKLWELKKQNIKEWKEEEYAKKIKQLKTYQQAKIEKLKE